MNKSISNYISELLFIHDCVVLPGFGGFVGNIKETTVNKITGEIKPPSKHLLFNINLKTNDGLLINYVENKEGITTKEAKRKVDNFIENIVTTLNDKRVIRIERVGILSINDEKKILFIQDNKINYNIQSFGLSNFSKKPIEKINLKEKINKEISSPKPKYLLRAAAIILPLLAMSYISISQQENLNLVYAKMGQINLLSSEILEKKSNLKNINLSDKEEIIKPAMIEAEETEIVEKPKITSYDKTEEEEKNNIIPKSEISNTKFYIIAGAFSSQSNANILVSKLRRENYPADIISGSSLIRVCYSSYDEKNNALADLEIIRNHNKSAWILTK